MYELICLLAIHVERFDCSFRRFEYILINICCRRLLDEVRGGIKRLFMSIETRALKFQNKYILFVKAISLLSNLLSDLDLYLLETSLSS